MVHWIRASKKQAVLYKSGSKIDMFPKINPSQETSEGWSSSLPHPAAALKFEFFGRISLQLPPFLDASVSSKFPLLTSAARQRCIS